MAGILISSLPELKGTDIDESDNLIINDGSDQTYTTHRVSIGDLKGALLTEELGDNKFTGSVTVTGIGATVTALMFIGDLSGNVAGQVSDLSNHSIMALSDVSDNMFPGVNEILSWQGGEWTPTDPNTIIDFPKSDWAQTDINQDSYIQNKPDVYTKSEVYTKTEVNDLVTSGGNADWNVVDASDPAYIKNKPSVFPPESHVHDYSVITNTPDLSGFSLKTEVAAVEAKADANTTSITNLAEVARTGSYNDLSDLPPSSTPPYTTTPEGITFDVPVTSSGSIQANEFIGDGSKITNLPFADYVYERNNYIRNLDTIDPNDYDDASSIHLVVNDGGRDYKISLSELKQWLDTLA